MLDRPIAALKAVFYKSQSSDDAAHFHSALEGDTLCCLPQLKDTWTMGCRGKMSRHLNHRHLHTCIKLRKWVALHCICKNLSFPPPHALSACVGSVAQLAVSACMYMLVLLLGDWSTQENCTSCSRHLVCILTLLTLLTLTTDTHVFM